jgi:hypothetical protein
MSDVVKTKTRLFFLVILFFQILIIYQIFINSAFVLKNLVERLTFSGKTPTTIEKVFWENPAIYAKISSKTCTSIQKLRYLNTTSLNEFENIKKNLEGVVFEGYFNPKHPENIRIDKRIEFQKIIHLSLWTLSEVFLEILLISGHHFSLFNFLFQFVRKKKKIPYKKLPA